MTPAVHLRGWWYGFVAAMQFLTRLPMPAVPYDAGSLARAQGFFPLAGGILGLGGALVHLAVAPHLPRLVAAFLVIFSLVLATGGLHEDGLADAADGFGGGTSREKVLLILRDSRIGSYGGLALVVSVLGRVLLIASLPLARVSFYLVAAGVLSRWTILPLSHFLASARPATAGDGQGARIARQMGTGMLIGGTIFSFVAAALLLGSEAIAPILGVIGVAWLTGAYYKRRIGGVTGDCFGATIQLAEIGVFLCGAWVR